MEACFDDLSENNQEAFEKEADEFACEALIPKTVWKKSGLSENYSAEKVRQFANQRRISPAIPAGRIRFEKKNYRILQELVGNRGLREMFAVRTNS